MRINYSEYSSIGGRKKNEDMVQIVNFPQSTVVLVADGLGGHGDGDIASRTAVHVISGAIGDGAASRTLMEDAICQANESILQMQARGSGMKTTIAALWMNEDHAWASHVGDTRIYQFRDGRIVYQSADHSVPQLSVMLGEITVGEIRGHAERNRLTRALGSRANVKIDSVRLEVRPGDAFLLCSDGFWELVWEEEMLDDLRQRVEQRRKPDSDNHTAAAILVI